MKRRTALLSVCFLFSALAINQAAHIAPVRLAAPLSSFPGELDGWRVSRVAPLDERTLAVLRVDDYVSRVYTGPGGVEAGIYVGYYAGQRAGVTVHSPLNCLPGAGWTPEGRRVVTLGGDAVVNQLTVRKGVERQLVIYWYQGANRVVASEYWGKAYTLLDGVRYRRSDIALVRVMAPMDTFDDAGRSRVEEGCRQLAERVWREMTRYFSPRSTAA